MCFWSQSIFKNIKCDHRSDVAGLHRHWTSAGCCFCPHIFTSSASNKVFQWCVWPSNSWASLALDGWGLFGGRCGGCRAGLATKLSTHTNPRWLNRGRLTDPLKICQIASSLREWASPRKAGIRFGFRLRVLYLSQGGFNDDAARWLRQSWRLSLKPLVDKQSLCCCLNTNLLQSEGKKRLILVFVIFYLVQVVNWFTVTCKNKAPLLTQFSLKRVI